jgi:uncharacterized phage-like protein YoqJ
MKWICISGSWRKTNEEIEEELRKIIREIITRGDGIVSGGALGVDYIATDEALQINPRADKIKIIIPTTLEKYAEHYRKHAKLGNITKEQAENLIKQLSYIKEINPNSLIEDPDTNFTEENKKARYYERNTRAVEVSDEIIAFRVKTKESEGLGTADTVEKAKERGIPVQLFTYDLS